MTPYQKLRQAVRGLGGVATAFEVQRELEAYLGQFRVEPPNGIVWSEIYTRQEYWEYVNRRRKRVKRKKGDADPVLYAYDSISEERVEARAHSPTLDAEFAGDFEWLDQVAEKFKKEIDDNGYHADF